MTTCSDADICYGYAGRLKYAAVYYSKYLTMIWTGEVTLISILKTFHF